jgi:hypothetical protein
MEVIDPGHVYTVSSFDDTNDFQQIVFIKKDGNSGEILKTIHDGTTNEEVLKCLIDRLGWLNKKLWSRETSIALAKTEEALMWLEKRTADRRNRNVEGKRLP